MPNGDGHGRHALKVEPPLTVRQVFDREMQNMETMRKSLREFGFKIGEDD